MVFGQGLPQGPARMLRGSGWQRQVDGESDTIVYRRKDVYAKVCDDRGRSELAAERDRINWLTETSIPGARVLDWLEGEDGAILFTSAVPGLPGSKIPASPKLMASVAAALRHIHDLAVEECPFIRRLEDVMRQAESVVEREAVNRDFLSEDLRNLPLPELMSRLHDSVPLERDLVVCHGDATLANLIFDPHTFAFRGAIDLGRLGVADRYSDLALMTAQVVQHGWTSEPSAFLHLYGLDRADEEKLAFYLLLDGMSWG